MFFVENQKEASNLLELLDTNPSIIHVYFQNNKIHPIDNKPIAVFINIKSNLYVISFMHPDVIQIPSQFLNMIMNSKGPKIIFDRKKLLYHVKTINNAIDYFVCSYLNLLDTLEVEYPSRTHDFRSIPIMKLLVHFKKLCSNILDNDIPDELVKYESDFSSALYQIEKNGMYVEDFKLGSSDLINDQNLVFTQYNMLTPTGRPSNSFGNVNYVALNKKTGDRSCFKSRFGNDGLLVMIDYESYHLRLVGNFLEYNLPTSSLHEYLGKIYYGKNDLTEEEYELSKKITFNLIYGGIDDDIKNNVPFMKRISDYVETTYSDFKKMGYVETWRYKRKIYSKFFGDKINSYKVFNYLLQSAETERNCIILNQINSYLKECVSKLILYTYDAFLFDVHKDEFLKFKEIDPVITSNGKFPVRTYIGKSYDSVRQI